MIEFSILPSKPPGLFNSFKGFVTSKGITNKNFNTIRIRFFCKHDFIFKLIPAYINLFPSSRKRVFSERPVFIKVLFHVVLYYRSEKSQEDFCSFPYCLANFRASLTLLKGSSRYLLKFILLESALLTKAPTI